MCFLYGAILGFFGRITSCFKSKRIFPLKFLEFVYNLKNVAVVAKAIITDKFQARRNRIDLPRRSGKVAVVTGGASGIGSEIVKMFLECDMEVIIACRNPAAGEKLIHSFRESALTSEISRVHVLDLRSLESVRKFGEWIRKEYVKIDILVNNAATFVTPYTETVDGFEEHWGVNYLGHFLLTSLLLPMLTAAGRPENRSRIVTVTSCMHRGASTDFENVNNKENYVSTVAYSRSKLALVMFTKTIQELFTKNGHHVEAYTVHPGIVKTNIFKDWPWTKYLRWILNRILKDLRQGATPIVWTALSDEVVGKGGLYFSNCGESSMDKNVENPEIRQRLFDLTLEQTRLIDFISSC